MHSSADVLNAIVRGLVYNGHGAFTVAYDGERKQWSVATEFGFEADDSDMAGGAAYGVGTTDEALAPVVERVIDETGWFNLKDSDAWPYLKELPQTDSTQESSRDQTYLEKLITNTEDST